MKLVFHAWVAVVAGSLVAAAPAADAAVSGSGTMASETRSVGEFDAVAQEGSIDVVIRQATRESVQVQAEDNVLPIVETVVESGANGRTLKIRFRRGEWVRHHKPVTVTVDAVRLGAIASSGSGDLHVQTMKTPRLKVSLSGSSDARIDGLATDALEVHISGSGDVSAAGTAKSVRLSIAGSGDASMAGLVADDVVVKIAGSGDADVTANQSLDVSVAGSGDVRYGGSATVVHSSMAGSGSLHKR